MPVEIPFNRKIEMKLNAGAMEVSRLPPSLWGVSPDKVPINIRKKIERFRTNIHEAVGTGVSLILYGKKGVGKTSVAALIIMEAKRWCYTATFINVWELREGIRTGASYNDSESLISRAKNVEVLVMDDLRPADLDTKDFYMSSRVVEELIRHRKMWNKLTVITTSMSKDEMSQPNMQGFRNAISASHLLEVKGEDLVEEGKKDQAKTIFGTD